MSADRRDIREHGQPVAEPPPPKKKSLRFANYSTLNVDREKLLDTEKDEKEHDRARTCRRYYVLCTCELTALLVMLPLLVYFVPLPFHSVSREVHFQPSEYMVNVESPIAGFVLDSVSTTSEFCAALVTPEVPLLSLSDCHSFSTSPRSNKEDENEHRFTGVTYIRYTLDSLNNSDSKFAMSNSTSIWNDWLQSNWTTTSMLNIYVEGPMSATSYEVQSTYPNDTRTTFYWAWRQRLQVQWSARAWMPVYNCPVVVPAVGAHRHLYTIYYISQQCHTTPLRTIVTFVPNFVAVASLLTCIILSTIGATVCLACMLYTRISSSSSSSSASVIKVDELELFEPPLR